MRATPASVPGVAPREPEGTACPDLIPRLDRPRPGGRVEKLKGGRHQADAPFRTCQVQKTGYFFFAAFFFVAFFFAAFFLAAIRGSPPPHLLLERFFRTSEPTARLPLRTSRLA
jgi:hypothetical protein